MSHVATVDIQVTDLDVLAHACKRLGLEFVRGQKTYKWYGRWMNDYSAPEAAVAQGIDPKDFGMCDHAIRIAGNDKAYEVGVVARKDGKLGWTLLWDFFAGGHGLQEKVGENCCKLRSAYAVVAAIKRGVQMGYVAQEQQNADGSIRVLLNK